MFIDKCVMVLVVNRLHEILSVVTAVCALSVSTNIQAEVVTYRLENVQLTASATMWGTFTWTYDAGDFENGVGEFIYLEIPWTNHDHTDLKSSFDIGGSIEITLEGSFHDKGLDINLVLAQPLTPTTSSLLVIGPGESKYDIGGNGFHAGLVQSGSVVPVIVPMVQFSVLSNNQLEVVFSGVLQASSDLQAWQDVYPQPTSPYVFTMTADKMFFRSRSY